MMVYVYCFIETSAPALSIDLEGIEEEKVDRIPADDFHAVVSPFTTGELPPTKENVFAHERVIDAYLETTTPLPCRFGTAIDESKLVEFAAAHRTALRTDFAKVRGCVEMGLKVSWGDAPLPDAPATVPSDNESNDGPGARFLKARLHQQEVQQQTARWVETTVADLIRLSSSSRIGYTSQIVRIAHLIPRENLVTYRERLDALLRTRPDGAFLRSGPWPPYSFVWAQISPPQILA